MCVYITVQLIHVASSFPLSLRDKRHNGWETWRDGILAEQVEQFRREVGDPAKMLIEVKGVGHLPRPTNEEVGMTKEQSAIIEVILTGHPDPFKFPGILSDSAFKLREDVSAPFLAR